MNTKQEAQEALKQYISTIFSYEASTEELFTKINRDDEALDELLSMHAVLKFLTLDEMIYIINTINENKLIQFLEAVSIKYDDNGIFYSFNRILNGEANNKILKDRMDIVESFILSLKLSGYIC